MNRFSDIFSTQIFLVLFYSFYTKMYILPIAINFILQVQDDDSTSGPTPLCGTGYKFVFDRKFVTHKSNGDISQPIDSE